MIIKECFKLLKPGLFVKCWGNSGLESRLSSPIVGEIGFVLDDEFAIFTDEIPNRPSVSGWEEYKEEAKKKGYRHAWNVKSHNTNEIEILDELPEEAGYSEDIEDITLIDRACNACFFADKGKCKTRDELIAKTLKQLECQNEQYFEDEDLERIIHNLHKLLDK